MAGRLFAPLHYIKHKQRDFGRKRQSAENERGEHHIRGEADEQHSPAQKYGSADKIQPFKARFVCGDGKRDDYCAGHENMPSL